MGITGTHDGFVPGPMDIYNRGTWGAGYGTASVVSGRSGATVAFNASNIELTGKGSSISVHAIISKQGSPINLQPYKTINVVYSNDMNAVGSQDVHFFLQRNNSISSYAGQSLTERTISLNISNIGITSEIVIDGDTWNAKMFIYRIYFT